MTRRILSFIVALFVLPSLALAHGPTRQKTSESIVIDAAPEAVWATLSEVGSMAWHPQVENVTLAGEGAEGSMRTLEFAGGSMEEELSTINDERMRLSTFIGKVNTDVLPATNYSSNITVKPVEDGAKSEVTWNAAFYRGYPNNNPPPELNEEAAMKGVTAYITEGLDGLKKAVEAGS